MISMLNVASETIVQHSQRCLPPPPCPRHAAFQHQQYRCRPQGLARHPHGFLDSLFGGEPSLHQDGPELVPLDVAEGGGLGGTSEGLFGPLVSESIPVPTFFNFEATIPAILSFAAHAFIPCYTSVVQAVLLVGFAQYEVDGFRKFMNDMDADIVKVIRHLLLWAFACKLNLRAFGAQQTAARHTSQAGFTAQLCILNGPLR